MVNNIPELDLNQVNSIKNDDINEPYSNNSVNIQGF